VDLDGQVCPDLIDVVGEQGDILRTFVNNATNPVAVGDQARRCCLTLLIR
jgi:hypothetical protein